MGRRPMSCGASLAATQRNEAPVALVSPRQGLRHGAERIG